MAGEAKSLLGSGPAHLCMHVHMCAVSVNGGLLRMRTAYMCMLGETSQEGLAQSPFVHCLPGFTSYVPCMQ